MSTELVWEALQGSGISEPSAGTQLGFHSYLSPAALTLLCGSVTQGSEMPRTRSSPKAAEGESWRPVEVRPALENTVQGVQTVGPLLPSWCMPGQQDPPG